MHVIKDDEIHIWWANTDLPQWDLPQMASLLSDDENNRADRFVSPRHRERFIVVHGLLRSLLGKYLGITPDSVKLLSDPKGKPYLDIDGGGGRLCFNLSHSHNISLFGMVLNRRIGVDVEYIRPLSNMESIARRYFSKREFKSVINSTEGKRDHIFFQYWTMIEAYLKATGDGLAGLRHVQINYDIARGNTPTASIRDFLEKSWSIYPLVISPEYCAAFALEGNCKATPILRQVSSLSFE